MALTMNGVDRDVRESIREFLYLESLALDERRFRDWLEAFAEDARYEIPVRVTREKLSQWELSPTSRIFDDTKETLDVRVKRLETDFAWSEQPPSRTRHFITNIVVQPTETPDEFLALSNCLVYRSRGEETTPSLFSAQRRDLLRREDAEGGDFGGGVGGDGESGGHGYGWLIVHRWAALDQAVVNAHNMSIFI